MLSTHRVRRRRWPTRLVTLLIGAAVFAGCAEDENPPEFGTPDADASSADVVRTDVGLDVDPSGDIPDAKPLDSDRSPPGDVDSGTWTFDTSANDGEVDGGTPDIALDKVTPNRGPVEGGTKFVIEGEGFTDETALFFGSNRAEVRLVDDQLVGQSPPAPGPGAVALKVQDPRTGNASIADGFTYTTGLRFDSAVPDSLPTRGGFQVTIKGEGFTADTRVSFDGTTGLSHEFVDSKTLRVIAPPHAPGTVDLRLTNTDDSVVATGAVEYVVPVAIDQVRPAEGSPSGGTTVTLMGTGFSSGMDVLFGGTTATVSSVASNGRQATVRTPAHAPGVVDVAVRVPGIGRDVAEKAFYYSPTGTSFELAALRPTIGQARGGTRVTLVGAGLDTSNLQVEFGGQPASVLTTGTGYATVATPAHATGRVDVTIRDGNGASSTLAKAFEYVSDLAIDSIQPNRGKSAGGKSVTIAGAGFTGTTEVLFGGVAAQFSVTSDTSIDVTAPPHAPGPVDVVVKRSDIQASREHGFTYTEKLRVDGLSPTRGSIAGNTYVEVRGRGFTGSSLNVEFGGDAAPSVRVLDTQTLAVRTPPKPEGTVDVRVERGTDGVVAPQQFTYYDPSSRNGGTWGGTVDGSVNVSVYSSGGAPVPNAFVMLSTSPNTRFTGRTDQNGLVTLSGPEVLGKQTVTATAANFSTTSIQQVDAENITIFLTRLRQPQPPPPDADTGVPPTDASFDSSLPDTTTTDTSESDGSGGDTGTPMNPDPRDTSVPPDPADTDPPDPPPPPPGPPVFTGQLTGLDKLAIPGAHEEHRAVVYTTRKDRWSRNPSPGGGNVLFEDGQYRITTRTGDLALIAVGGLYNTQTREFEPLMMGIKRYQFATKGKTYRRDIDLDIPLDQTLTFKISNQPFDRDGPDTHYVEPLLDFGFEGVFGQLPDASGQTSLVQAVGYPELKGRISDVTISAFGGSYTRYGPTSFGIPQTVVLEEGFQSTSQTLGLGRLIGVPHMTQPAPRTRPQNGLIAFRMTDSEEPDFFRVQIYTPQGKTVWEAFIPGSATKVRLPTFPDFSAIPEWRRPDPYPDGTYQMRIVGIRHQTASLDNFTYTDLPIYKLPAFSINFESIIF